MWRKGRENKLQVGNNHFQSQKNPLPLKFNAIEARNCLESKKSSKRKNFFFHFNLIRSG